MSRYDAPLADIRFVMHGLLDAEREFARLGFEDATRDVLDAVFEEGARFARDVLAPLNRVGDETGCGFDTSTGEVTTPPGFREAYVQYVEGGWAGLVASAAHGGQGLPQAAGFPVKEMVDAANLAWGNFPLLSHGAIEALAHYGTDWQKQVFLAPLVEGRWTGTMCLTEPHCGSDLGLLRTRAEPRADGTYALSGTKIFITAGEHDMAENIVHLVLARLPDAPAGSRGISLFVVPKVRVAQDGSPGERNALRCGSLEHKMGIHGSATCVMNFDGAEGYLVGEPHKGLAIMFVMMNSARLGVGLQGLGLSDRALQNAVAYSRDRLQMRLASGAKYPDRPADPIIVHPDVRRMLLTCKALVEGGRALAYDAGLQLDISHHAPDAAEREEAEALVGFLTPIVKACLTEWSVECTYDALQCFGGHGYIREHGMEQLARDARITTLYEGTTGIQALDLLGRKVMLQKGAGMKPMLARMRSFCEAHRGHARAGRYCDALLSLASQWQGLAAEIARRCEGDADELGAAAYDFLMFSGYACLAYWWARSVAVADEASPTPAFARAKHATARFYFERLLPRAQMHAAAISAGAQGLMELDDEAFDAVR